MKHLVAVLAGATALLSLPAPASAQALVPLDSAGVTLLQSGGVTAAPAQDVAVPQRMTQMPMSTGLPSGSRLSVALERFIRERGWDIRWNIDEDYVLDAQLPIPTSDVIEAVTWVVHTYQSQGGMPGVVPRFARANKIVVIEKMDVRESL